MLAIDKLIPTSAVGSYATPSWLMRKMQPKTKADPIQLDLYLSHTCMNHMAGTHFDKRPVTTP